jgi:hypothetical protein
MKERLFDIFSVAVNARLEPLEPLVKCDHQSLEWNVNQNSNHPIEKLFCSLEFCRLAAWGVGRMWRTFQFIIREILLDYFCDVWPGIVGVCHESPTISCITKGAYFEKNVTI